ncbi:hypothetical protein MTO96_045935 [Rhipicephalus appendiculatus]
MDNSLPDPTSSGLALSAGRSRQMETLLKEASRIIGKQGTTTAKHLSPKEDLLCQEGANYKPPWFYQGRQKSKNRKRSLPPPPDVEEATPGSCFLYTNRQRNS